MAQLTEFKRAKARERDKMSFLIFWPNIRGDGRGMVSFFVLTEFKEGGANAQLSVSCSHRHEDNFGCGSSWAPSSQLH